MATLKATSFLVTRPAPTVSQFDAIAVRYEYSLAAALALNDIVALGILPAGMVPVDCIMDVDDLDTGGAPTLALSVGLLNDPVNPTDLSGTAWIVSATTGQAGGMIRPTTNTMYRVAPTTANRGVGVKVATGPQTGATTGKIGLTLIYRPALFGL